MTATRPDVPQCPATRRVGQAVADRVPWRGTLPEDIDTSADAVVALAGHLLDQGLPFQAHEALEAVWKVASEPERTAWKGMAQLAVALTHAMRGNATGAVRVRERGLLNLAAGELPAVALRDRLLDLTSGP